MSTFDRFAADRRISYQIGDIIEYSAFGGERRTVLVDEKEADIKNGRPGFSGTLVGGVDNGQGVWGYDDQIEYVVTRAAR